ncbi:uncharacterized protein [Aegilops tauschii subsp. strangulata]|uniref:uncharacterized protein isoform X2 n=1 Tax=Aegilops tauschii subsp. strangulata TaxID=200361 RepID=UPI003CC8703B
MDFATNSRTIISSICHVLCTSLDSLNSTSIHDLDMAATKPGAAAMAQCQEGSAEEHRLRAALRHLQAEAGVLECLVYKHRNQHRGAAYFQYLLKVRRDLKLLLGAHLAESINAMFPVITCRKPANTILVPNRQGKRKPGANHSHYKRLLGVARLLSQMAEPVMKGAVQISFLLARSFFVELCTAVLALLARVRVLTQQVSHIKPIRSRVNGALWCMPR